RMLRAGVRAPRAADASRTPVPDPVVDSRPDTASLEADRLALTHRVESLEQSLQETRRELQQRRSQQTEAPPPPPRAVPGPQAAAKGAETGDASAPPLYRRAPFIALVVGLGLMLALGIWSLR